jgi:hypothetical protein
MERVQRGLGRSPHRHTSRRICTSWLPSEQSSAVNTVSCNRICIPKHSKSITSYRAHWVVKAKRTTCAMRARSAITRSVLKSQRRTRRQDAACDCSTPDGNVGTDIFAGVTITDVPLANRRRTGNRRGAGDESSTRGAHSSPLGSHGASSA